MRKVIRYTAILVARSFWTLLSNSWNRRASASDGDSPTAAGGPAPGHQAPGGRRSTWEPSPPPTKAQPQSRAVPEAPPEAPHLPNMAGPPKCPLWRQRGFVEPLPGSRRGGHRPCSHTKSRRRRVSDRTATARPGERAAVSGCQVMGCTGSWAPRPGEGLSFVSKNSKCKTGALPVSAGRLRPHEQHCFQIPGSSGLDEPSPSCQEGPRHLP